MFSLSDSQLVAVMDAAADLPPDKRSTFLERIAARIRLRDRPIVLDDEFQKVVRSALTGLVQASRL
jgi:hypothetical protein